MKVFEKIIENLKMLPNDNPSHYYTADVIDRELAIDTVEEVEEEYKNKIFAKVTGEETKEYIERLIEDKNSYVYLVDLTKRFVEIDKEYKHELWDLQQILANISMVEYVPKNGWIPVDLELPKENIEVEVTIMEEYPDGGKSYYTDFTWLQDGRWIIKKNPFHSTVIAWKKPTEPYIPEE